MIGSLTHHNLETALPLTANTRLSSTGDRSSRLALLSCLAETVGISLSLGEFKDSADLSAVLAARGVDVVSLKASLPLGVYFRLSQLWALAEESAFCEAGVQLGEDLCRKRETRELGLVVLAWFQEHLGSAEKALLARAQKAEQKALGVGLSMGERAIRVAESAQHALGDGVGLGSMVVGQGFGMAGKYGALQILAKQSRWAKVLGAGFSGFALEGAGFAYGHRILGKDPRDLTSALKSSYGMLGSLRLGGGLVNGGLFLLGSKGAGLRQIGSRVGMATGLGVWHGYASPALRLGSAADPLQAVVEDFVAFEAMGSVLGMSHRYQQVQQRFHQETDLLLQQSHVQLAARLAKLRSLTLAPTRTLVTAQGIPVFSSSIAIPEIQGPMMMAGRGIFGRGRRTIPVEQLAGSPEPKVIPETSTPPGSVWSRIGRWATELPSTLGFTGPKAHVGEIRTWFFDARNFGVMPDAYFAAALREAAPSLELREHLITSTHRDHFDRWLTAEPVHAETWFTATRQPSRLTILGGEYGNPGVSRPGERFSQDVWGSMSSGYTSDITQTAIARWRYLREYLDQTDPAAVEFFTKGVAGWLPVFFPKGLKYSAFDTVIKEHYLTKRAGTESEPLFDYIGEYGLPSREQIDPCILMTEEIMTRLEELKTVEARQSLIKILSLAKNRSVEGTHTGGKGILDKDFKLSDIKHVNRHPHAALYQRVAESLVRLGEGEALPIFAKHATHQDPVIAAASLRGLAQLGLQGHEQATKALFARGLYAATNHAEAEAVATPADLAVAMERLNPEWWQQAQAKTQAWEKALEDLSQKVEGASAAKVKTALGELTSHLQQMRYSGSSEP